MKGHHQYCMESKQEHGRQGRQDAVEYKTLPPFPAYACQTRAKSSEKPGRERRERERCVSVLASERFVRATRVRTNVVCGSAENKRVGKGGRKDENVISMVPGARKTISMGTGPVWGKAPR